MSKAEFFINRVEVTIIGKIIDMNYANILAENTSLSLMDIELLNRVQLNRSISESEVRYLRKSGLIEGRMPNIYISKDVAQKTDRSIEYSKHKGLKDKVCEELLLGTLKDHKALTKSEIVVFIVFFNHEINHRTIHYSFILTLEP